MNEQLKWEETIPLDIYLLRQATGELAPTAVHVLAAQSRDEDNTQMNYPAVHSLFGIYLQFHFLMEFLEPSRVSLRIRSAFQA